MIVNRFIPFTVSQHAHERESIAVIREEIATAKAKYGHKCDFCLRTFKTDRAMHIHRANCVHNDSTTDDVCTVENIVGVFSHKDTRFFLRIVKWEGYEEPEWEREYLLKRDKYHDMIRSFWTTSHVRSTQEFYPDTDDKNRCTV